MQRPVPEAGPGLADTCAWALRQMHLPLTVTELARRAGYSSRTFARRFVDETGTTPLRWLTAQRLLEARRLLEATDISIEEVAQRTGLGTPANLRIHLARETGTTPTAYRRAFHPGPKVPEAISA
jgi:AraC family transcriptional activator FtrA